MVMSRITTHRISRIAAAPSDPPFQNLARQMSKSLEAMQKGYFNFCPNETWTPSVNLYETDASYVVCVDLAGVQKEKIEVWVENQHLRIRGSRKVPLWRRDGEGDDDDASPSQEKLRVHLMEIDHGAFCRDVELPQDVAQDQIAATHRNGMLWIELPKK